MPGTDHTLRSKVYFFFFSLLLVSLGNFAVLVLMENKSLNYYQQVSEAYEIREQSHTLLSYLVDAETGQRGYLLTEDSAYLTPYYSGVNGAEALLQKMFNHSVQDKSRQTRIATIQFLVAEKFAELANTIELTKAGSKDTAMEVVASNFGMEKMKQIRQQIKLLNVSEEKFLKEQNEQFLALQASIKLIFIVESVLFLVVLSLVIYRVKNTVLQPISQIVESLNAFKVNQQFTPLSIDSKDEIGQLANAFNTMAQAISRQTVNLKDKTRHAETQKNQMFQMAVKDPLTTLYNRRYMDIELAKMVATNSRYRQGLCIVMADIDHFKKVNDAFGHTVGDIVLIALGHLIKQVTRESDLAVRYGGEEFLIALPHTKSQEAGVWAEKLRQHVESLSIDGLQGNYITISLGVAEMDASEASVEQVITRADEALYEAKNSGRNRVCIKCTS